MDDGDLPFESREDIIFATNIHFKKMARLGLNMHVGTEGNTSKAEAVYFLSRTKILYWLKEHDEKLLPSPEDSTVVSDPRKKLGKNAETAKTHN